MNADERQIIENKLGPVANSIAPVLITMVDSDVDAVIPIDRDAFVHLTEAEAGAYTLAVPGAANIGRRLVLCGGSDFAHVVTAASTSVRDGTTGGHGTLTSPAFQGGTLTLRAVTAAIWQVEANNLWVIT